MYQIDFSKLEHAHFIGIGSINMNGLAEILLGEGSAVTGSDSHEAEFTDRPTDRGARVYYSQRAANIGEEPGISVVVYTATIHKDNPGFTTAKEEGIPVLSRVKLLGEIMRNYKQAMVVSGTRGKTTTTSIITDILLAGDIDLTIPVGGILQDIGDSIRMGGSGLFVIETCEYANSFLSFFPTMEVILNIEEDHLGSLKNIQDIRHSFRLFAEKLLAARLLVVNSGIEVVDEIIKGLGCRMMASGKDAASTYTTQNISCDEYARPSYDLVVQGEIANRITLGVTGKHNVYNSPAIIAVAMELGVEFDAVMSSLKKLTDMNRRFEKKDEVGGVIAIDDYAHHPQEIRTMLSTVKNYPRKRLWCVFRPHTYARTKAPLDQFADALFSMGVVIPADTYAARGADTLGVSSGGITDRIRGLGTEAHYIPSFDEIEIFTLENCTSGDLLTIMGAGDVVEVGERLLGRQLSILST